ncbi:hypothetical protein ACF3NG_07005 [Aerococcaceae bacterium WGS1372]
MDWKDLGDKTLKLAKGLGEKHQKAKQESTITLTNKTLGAIKKTKVRKKADGTYYISDMFSESKPTYEFDFISFNGSKITHETTTKGKTTQQGRAGSVLVGSMLFGDVGAVMGGARKRKGKFDSKSKTVQTEKPGKGTVNLKSVDDGTTKKINFIATQSEFDNIERYFK